MAEVLAVYIYRLVNGEYSVKCNNPSSCTKAIIPAEYEGIPVTQIYSTAFEDCTKLESVEIPNSITTIGNTAFEGCTSLKSIVIPSSVKTIGTHAFLGSGLESIVIPDSVESIGLSAFYECYSLKNIKLSNSLTSISENLFLNCKSLTSIVIPDSVENIGAQAFLNCESLTSIVIPDSVESIGSRAFEGCTSLKSMVLLPANPPLISDSTFDNINEKIKFYCHSSYVNTYKEARFWSGYKSKIFEDDIRVLFTMSSMAQKRYFPNKEYVVNKILELTKELVSDTQINGTSIVENGIANIPLATALKPGVIRAQSSYGCFISGDNIFTALATNGEIDAKTSKYKPIVPTNLDYAVKVGVTTNTNTLSDDDKQAAQAWLGISKSTQLYRHELIINKTLLENELLEWGYSFTKLTFISPESTPFTNGYLALENTLNNNFLGSVTAIELDEYKYSNESQVYKRYSNAYYNFMFDFNGIWYCSKCFESETTNFVRFPVNGVVEPYTPIPL